MHCKYQPVFAKIIIIYLLKHLVQRQLSPRMLSLRNLPGTGIAVLLLEIVLMQYTLRSQCYSLLIKVAYTRDREAMKVINCLDTSQLMGFEHKPPLL